MKKLQYSIHKCSSFASTYAPENIQHNKSNDQTSRWSSETNYQPQYLILKLQAPSIIETITFGKYEKIHVCNLKKFKIFGGMTDKCTTELLESGLKNDSTPETFSLKVVIDGHSVPCRFIKIMPLQCWGPSFNFSIWFVELMGTDDWSILAPCLQWFYQYQEQEVVRLCLKHFRQHNYDEAFRALQSQTNVALEHHLITELHDVLVQQGSYQEAEEFMERAISDGFFNDFISKQDYRPFWSTMLPGEGELRPGMRGGHQMCIDSYTETIYLFGGWDGDQDLNDFWSYHIPSHKWTLISRNTEADKRHVRWVLGARDGQYHLQRGRHSENCIWTDIRGGPSPRSCHKLCLDPERRQIFTLGRYIDPTYKSQEDLKSDFYMYDIESNTWTSITEDTAHMGGPELIFDHQMCMDVKQRTIYVFGGRILIPPFGNNCPGIVGVTEVKFSGLYSYHVSTNTWTQLYDDCAAALVKPGVRTLKSRAGHCMLFHPGYRKLFIFAGQRSKEFLNDFFTYNVDTGEIHTISDGTKREENTPGPGFTQRATIDADLDEIYVLSGLSKDKEKRDDNVQSLLWVYSIIKNQWTCIYKNENVSDNYWKVHRAEPCPRFAHQLVYDHINKVHYLFGGNPGRSYFSNLRLDDFWKLHLIRPTRHQLLQKFKFMIRRHRFEELAMQNSLNALNYLQTAVSDIIDHDDPEQTKEFQLLAAVLFQKRSNASNENQEIESDLREQRIQLFDKLVEFFPVHMTQPKYNLIDIMQLTPQKTEINKF